MDVQRRSFLSMGAGGLLGALLGARPPAWLRAGFQEGEGERDAEPLAAAWREAARTARPLLVIVVPAEPRARHDALRLWGELLNHGSEAVLADLATAVVACAPLADVRARLPRLAGLPEPSALEGGAEGARAPADPAESSVEPLALLVDPDSRTARAIRPELPPEPETFWGDDEPETWEERYVAAVRARIAALEAALSRALAPSCEVLAERAGLAVLALDDAQRARLASDLVRPVAERHWIAEHAPAVLRLAAADAGPDARAALVALLAATAARRLREAPPPGSRWATSDGCGIRVEGEERPPVACGMARVPEISRRFLVHYTER